MVASALESIGQPTFEIDTEVARYLPSTSSTPGTVVASPTKLDNSMGALVELGQGLKQYHKPPHKSFKSGPITSGDFNDPRNPEENDKVVDGAAIVVDRLGTVSTKRGFGDKLGPRIEASVD